MQARQPLIGFPSAPAYQAVARLIIAVRQLIIFSGKLHNYPGYYHYPIQDRNRPKEGISRTTIAPPGNSAISGY